MAVRTKELGSGSVTGATTTVVYTCPAGHTAIVKEMTLTANAGSGAPLWQVRRGALVVPIESGAPGINLVKVTGPRFLVLEPGDQLELLTTAGATIMKWWVSGSELSGVA